MDYSQSGIHLTEQFESCRLTAYPDSNSVQGETLDFSNYSVVYS